MENGWKKFGIVVAIVAGIGPFVFQIWITPEEIISEALKYFVITLVILTLLAAYTEFIVKGEKNGKKSKK